MLHHITLQGVIILFFHVIRNERVWSKICSQFTAIRQKTLSSTFWSEVVCSEFKHLLVIKQHIKFDDNRSLLRVDLLNMQDLECTSHHQLTPLESSITCVKHQLHGRITMAAVTILTQRCIVQQFSSSGIFSTMKGGTLKAKRKKKSNGKQLYNHYTLWSMQYAYDIFFRYGCAIVRLDSCLHMFRIVQNIRFVNSEQVLAD